MNESNLILKELRCPAELIIFRKISLGVEPGESLQLDEIYRRFGCVLRFNKREAREVIRFWKAAGWVELSRRKIVIFNEVNER